MSDLRVKRWTRYGRDRLFVKTPQGRDVGWFDLGTGATGSIDPAYAVKFWQAIHAYRFTTGPGGGPITRTPPTTGPSPAPGRDLQDNTPGAAVTARAARERRTRPVWSKVAPVLGVRSPDQAWAVGATGERIVGARLNRLRRHGWHVLHSIPLAGGGDVDHLLIHRSGVWCVNTKHHRHRDIHVTTSGIRVGRDHTDYPDRALREAMRVSRALSTVAGHPVHVTPVLVMVGHRHLAGAVLHRPGGVQVLSTRWATTWFRLHRTPRSGAVDADGLYAAAREPGTWGTN